MQILKQDDRRNVKLSVNRFEVLALKNATLYARIFYKEWNFFPQKKVPYDRIGFLETKLTDALEFFPSRRGSHRSPFGKTSHDAQISVWLTWFDVRILFVAIDLCDEHIDEKKFKGWMGMKKESLNDVYQKLGQVIN